MAENFTDIFNGDKPEVLNQDKPKKAVSLEEAKANYQRNSGDGVPFVSSKAYSNFDNGIKFGSRDAFATSRVEDAEAQTAGQYIGKFTGNTLANIVTGTIGGIGYLGTILESGKNKDYSNALTEWSEAVRNPFGEVKTKSDDILDISDPAFWVNNGQGLVESAVQFGIIAETGGLAAGALISKLGKAVKLTNTASKLISAGMQGLTAVELSYIEGAMSGATVYKDIYETQFQKNIKNGLSNEEADKIAKEYASKGASTTVQLNTTINSALNLTGMGAVFNREISPALKYFKDGLGKRLEGETAKDYIRRLAVQSPEFINQIGKAKYGHLFAEMGQEGVEEVITQLAENTGREQGIDGKTYGFGEQFQEAVKSVGSVMNSEGVLNFALGALGGISQTVLLENIIPSQKVLERDSQGKLIPVMKNGEVELDKDGNVKYQTKLVSPRKRDMFDQLRYFNELKDSLETDLNFIEQQHEKITNEGNPFRKEDLRRQLFAVNTLDSIFKGTGENLIESYRQVSAVDNSKDLSEEFSKQAEEVKKQASALLKGSQPENLSEEERQQYDALTEQYKELQKKSFDYQGITRAMEMKLADNKEDKGYVKRGQKAVEHITRINEAYNKFKEKYNLPQETNVHYPEYLTKLYADIIGRETIQQDLEADYLKNKADFQVFSNINDFAQIEEMLKGSEILHLNNQRKDLNNVISEFEKTQNFDLIEEHVQELPKVTNDFNEALTMLKEKSQKLKDDYIEKENDFLESVKESEAFKKAKTNNPKTYVEGWIKKYPEFARLQQFKGYLDTFKRNTDDIKARYNDAQTKEGRDKFIKGQTNQILEAKRQIELEHERYTYQEYEEELENEAYYERLENLKQIEQKRVKREIKNVQTEIEALESSVDSSKNKSKTYSLLKYLNNLAATQEQIKFRRQRLEELNEILNQIEEKYEEAKSEIANSKGQGNKENVVAGVDPKNKTPENPTGETETQDELLSDEAVNALLAGQSDEEDDLELYTPTEDTPITEEELNTPLSIKWKSIYDAQKNVVKVAGKGYLINGKQVDYRVSQIIKDESDDDESTGSSGALLAGSALDKVIRQYVSDVQGLRNPLLVKRAIKQKDYKAMRKMLNNPHFFFNLGLDELDFNIEAEGGEQPIRNFVETSSSEFADSEVLNATKAILRLKEGRKIAAATIVKENNTVIVKNNEGVDIAVTYPKQAAFNITKFIHEILSTYKNYHLVSDGIVLHTEAPVGLVAGETDIIGFAESNNGVIYGKVFDIKTAYYNSKTGKSNFEKFESPIEYDGKVKSSAKTKYTRQTSLYSYMLAKQFGVTLTDSSQIIPFGVAYNTNKFDGIYEIRPEGIKDRINDSGRKVYELDKATFAKFKLPVDLETVNELLSNGEEAEGKKGTDHAKNQFGIDDATPREVRFVNYIMGQYKQLEDYMTNEGVDNEGRKTALIKFINLLETSLSKLIKENDPETKRMIAILENMIEASKKGLDEIIKATEPAEPVDVSVKIQELLTEFQVDYAKTPYAGSLEELLNLTFDELNHRLDELRNAFVNATYKNEKELYYRLMDKLTSIIAISADVDKRLKTKLKTELTKAKKQLDEFQEEPEDGEGGGTVPPSDELITDLVSFDDLPPVTLDMFRLQYGDVDEKGKLKKDGLNNFEVKEGMKVELSVEPIKVTAHSDKVDKAEVVIAINVYDKSGRLVSRGTLPTLEFMTHTYNGGISKPFIKQYFEDSVNPEIQEEFAFVVNEANRIGQPLNNFVTQKVTKEGQVIKEVNYTKFNIARIKHLRELMRQITANNKKATLSGQITSTSEGRAITNSKFENKRKVRVTTSPADSGILDDKRLSLTMVNEGALFPVVSNLSKQASNVLNIHKNNTRLYISYPNANGTNNLHPCGVRAIGDRAIDSKEVKKKLDLLYYLMVNSNEEYNEYIKNFLVTFGDTERSYPNMTKLFSFNNIDYNGKNVRDYVIRTFDNEGNYTQTNLYIKSKGSNVYTLNPNFKQALSAIASTPISISKKMLEKDSKFKELSYVEKENKLYERNISYLNYISDYIITDLNNNSENKDSSGNQIYVKDFRLNFALADDTPSLKGEVSETNVIKKEPKKQEPKQQEPEKIDLSAYDIDSDLNSQSDEDIIANLMQAQQEEGKAEETSDDSSEGTGIDLSGYNETGDDLLSGYEDSGDSMSDLDLINLVNRLKEEEAREKSNQKEAKQEEVSPKTNDVKINISDIEGLEDSNDEDFASLSPIVISTPSSLYSLIKDNKTSKEPHLVFTASFSESNILNNSNLSEIEKVNLLNEALKVSSQEEAVRLFDKICKQ